MTEKTFILEDYEDLLPGDDSDYRRIQKATIDSSVLHISATEHTGLPLATLEYLHRDHLGSVEKITDADGNLLTGATGRFAYDPFGARREPDWSGTLGAQLLTDLLASQGLSTKRGFTNHEHLDRTGLIHMNGRIYDPALGRFLSPDPFVQAPNNSQSWNRYSYVFNNPLSLTDPSGYLPMDEVTVEGKRLPRPIDGLEWDYLYGDYFGDGSSSYYNTWYNQWKDRSSKVVPRKEDTEKAIEVAQKERSFWDNPGAYLPSLPDGLVNAAAGFGDGFSFGLTDVVRDWVGTNGVVDQSSSEYGLSTVAGQLTTSAILIGGVLLRPFTAQSQVVTQWTTTGQLGANTRWVMTGGNSYRNYVMAGGPQLQASYSQSVTAAVSGNSLRWPSGGEWFKGFLGQRILK
ncbi:RHS repeat-associated core domain-containing protein [Microbulbifer spongiae]|uniref:RHS repeat-associated core domain-containing protein n=1 Tax=Microbulbifer spongiae TaxID=2944933 RepID=A0ABY9EDD3_9GAMM|nr:RHS repeat-associated core domain-containing protein [Microbulbifer sp. MI-G]WKD51028.1 RHS repeat-associated core domain-containing protein [Microbulbifer sp. MI-G]